MIRKIVFCLCSLSKLESNSSQQENVHLHLHGVFAQFSINNSYSLVWDIIDEIIVFWYKNVKSNKQGIGAPIFTSAHPDFNFQQLCDQ